MADKQIDKYLPKLRFPEFKDEGEWQVVRLGDVVRCFSGGTPSATNKDYYGGDIPFIRSGELHSSKTELYLTRAGLENSSAKMVEKGTILYALYGATSGDVGIARVSGAINQAILAIIPNVNIDKMYLYQYLSYSKDFIINRFLQGGQGNLSASIITSLSIPLPTIQEQKKIASCLSSLDECIALSKKKLEQLKAHKKGLMQKLFPASGKTLPEYRFKEFKNVWIEHALHDIGIFVKGLSYNSYDVTQDTSSTLVIRSTNIIPEQKVDCQNGLQFVIKRPSDEQILQKGDVAICLSNGSSNLVGKTSFFEGDYSGIATVGAFCGIYRSKVPITKYLVQTETYRKSIDLIKQGGNGALSNLYGNDILRLRFFLPAEEEQRKIASCLEQIDKMISLLGGKIDYLCLYKRGLLQQLFPSRIVSYVGTI